MNGIRTIHPDELPERCRQDIRRFFSIPAWISERGDGSPRRDPVDYVILVSKEKGTGNYPKWQASFLRKSDVGRFQSYHLDDLDRYFRVIQDGLDLSASRCC